MIEDVIEKVEGMETFALDRRFTASLLLALREVLGRAFAIRVDECDQVLAKGSDPHRGRNQVGESPLLAFLSIRRGTKTYAAQLSSWSYKGEMCCLLSMCVQTWTLEGEHSAVVVFSNASVDSISSREQDCGSARKRAPVRAALATISSADVDAMAKQSRERMSWSDV